MCIRDRLYIIDQHAAHEKVLYERILQELKEKKITSQILSPPLIVSVTLQEETVLREYMDVFASFGFEIESFGGREYSIRAVPYNPVSYTHLDVYKRQDDNQIYYLWKRTGPPVRGRSVFPDFGRRDSRKRRFYFQLLLHIVCTNAI